MVSATLDDRVVGLTSEIKDFMLRIQRFDRFCLQQEYLKRPKVPTVSVMQSCSFVKNHVIKYYYCIKINPKMVTPPNEKLYKYETVIIDVV